MRNILSSLRLLCLTACLLVSIGQARSAAIARTDSVMASFTDAATMFYEQTDYAESLRLFLRFIHMAEKNPHDYQPQLMEAYCRLGIIYGSYGDYEQSLSYSQKSYQLSKELGNITYEQAAIANISTSLMALGRYEEATASNERLLEVAAPDTSSSRFSYYVTKGDIAWLTNHTREAAQAWRDALALAERHEIDPGRHYYPLSRLAEYYESVGQPDSQLVYLEKAFALAQEQRLPYPQVSMARDLMQFFTRHGDMERALQYQDLYFSLTDSLMNIDSFLKANTDHGQMELGERGRQIEQLSFTVSRQWFIIGIVGVSLLIALAICLLVYRQKQRLRRAYMAVYERNKELIQVEAAYRESQKAQQAAAEPKPIAEEAATKEEADDKGRADTLYARIEEVMEDAAVYCDPEFGLTRLASMVGAGTVYVSKVIKERHDTNVPTFINTYRIREARRRIMDPEHYGQYTIQAIAESVGYTTQVHFNRMFKKITGITPTIYQRMMQEEMAKKHEKPDEMG